MKFVSLSALWWIIIVRFIFPIFWCGIYLFSTISSDKHYDTVLLLLSTLVFQLVVFLLLIQYIVKIISHRNRLQFSENIQVKTKGYGVFFSIILIFLLFVNYDSLPIFMDLGSDSIVMLGEMSKVKTWLVYGSISVLVTILLAASMNEKNHKKRMGFRFIAFLASISTGKKSALLEFFMKYFLIQFIFLKNKKINMLFILFAMFLSLFFGAMQFFNTSVTLQEGSWVGSIFYLLYSHGTVYLAQFINLNGVDFALSYSESISGGAFSYFLNPFVKFVTGSGIDKAIGPYLSYHLFGNTFPNGVNPTLFFELIFVFGDILYGFFVIPIMIIWLYIQKIIFRKVVMTHVFLLKVGFLLLFFFFFGLLFDSLNTIRSLPFVLIPFVIYFFLKLLALGAKPKFISEKY